MITEHDSVVPVSAFRLLTNRYFALRHGHSLANEAGVIVSDPATGVHQFGLSTLGRKQAQVSASKITLNLAGENPTQFMMISSDFLRARETAQIVRQNLPESVTLRFDERLRERFFGQLEGGSDALYSAVWEEDRRIPDTPENGVESLHSVARRCTSLIREIEAQYTGWDVILVAHGDILQILQCLFTGTETRYHRSLPNLDTAELRQLNEI